MPLREKDPVCAMPVEPSPNAATASHAGRTYYFCSALCRTRFLVHPALYVKAVPRSMAPRDPSDVRIAYFSMEVAFATDIPTYSGGLGVLAGDTIRSMADLRVPAVAVSLVHRRGYFRQTLAVDGSQHEQPALWSPESRLKSLPHVVHVELGGRSVAIGAWRYDIESMEGLEGSTVSLLLLDTDRPENAEDDRHLTDRLYGGDGRYRLAQEIVLGIGGMRMLAAAGYTGVLKLHLNEGHAAFAALELLQSQYSNPDRTEWNFEAVRDRCIFTTHTPVPAGHDHFDWGLVQELWGDQTPRELFRMLGGNSGLNMTSLALNLSGFVNGVARQHQSVTQQMFPGYEIQGVTNGVHSVYWTNPELRAVYDQRLPGWRSDPLVLRNALSIPRDSIWNAHELAKRRLLDAVRARTGITLQPSALTLGFARRVTAYKRTDLIFTELQRLRSIAAQFPVQLVFAGKAHPHDESGKDLIRSVFAAARHLQGSVAVVYLPEYDVELAHLLVAGVDVWLNTPEPPLEASGTSGMKAAHNGVPSLSTLDGWWLEGHVEARTGWSIGARGGASDRQRDANELYTKLENAIGPVFYRDRNGWIDIMQHTIALNASFFNTHRMVHQYSVQAYL